jgi:ribonuclease Z
VAQATNLGVDRIHFPVEIQELSGGDSVEFGDYEVRAFDVSHGTSAVGYALREHPRLGRFDVERARALGVPEGPLFGKLHRGETVSFSGRVVEPGEVVGDPRPGRLVVYTGDTRPFSETIRVARGANLLIHEATFLQEEAGRASETFHSTALEAAEVAREAGVERLILTHISARYSEFSAPVAEEGRSAFPNTLVAHDGMALELGYDSSDKAKGGETRREMESPGHE